MRVCVCLSVCVGVCACDRERHRERDRGVCVHVHGRDVCVRVRDCVCVRASIVRVCGLTSVLCPAYITSHIPHSFTFIFPYLVAVACVNTRYIMQFWK